MNGPRDVGPLSFFFFFLSFFLFWPASLIAAHAERGQSLSYPTVIASSIANSPAKEINTHRQQLLARRARARTHKMARNDDDGGLIVNEEEKIDRLALPNQSVNKRPERVTLRETHCVTARNNNNNKLSCTAERNVS